MASIDGRDHVAVRPRAVLIQHLQVDQVDVGRHAVERAREAGPVESLPLDADDSGHVRAMAVKIGAGQPGHEALAVDDARTRCREDVRSSCA